MGKLFGNIFSFMILAYLAEQSSEKHYIKDLEYAECKCFLFEIAFWLSYLVLLATFNNF